MIARVVPSARLFLALVAAVGAGAGCEQPNSLEGTISESFDLSFDTVELRRFNGVTLQLDYLRDVEGADIDDVVCKVVFDTPEGGIPAGEAIDITQHNGIVERIATGGDDFPGLDTANITFETGGNEPGPASGRFVVTFDTGKTLNGNFDTDMEDVTF